jgi:limonene-1,2-epoxide hydrolase
MEAATIAPPAQAETVREFLRLLEQGETDAAMELLTEDAVWINVTLPTVRGRRRIERVIRALTAGGQFRAHFHHVATHGEVVLTERTDELAVGPLKQRFWVYGRFELRDGRIAVWRDSFDWLDLAVSLARAAAGVVAPGLNRPRPGDD